MWAVHFAKSLRPIAKIRENLALHSSLKIGGYADIWFEPRTLCDLWQGVLFAREEGIPFYIVGAGTNIVFPDEGIKGVVAALDGEFQTISFDIDSCCAGCGVGIQTLLRESLIRSLGGCEFLAGIPGTVGGAIAMNAGTAQDAIGKAVSEVICLDRDRGIVRLGPEELRFGYRTCALEDRIALFCKLRLLRKERAEIMTTIYAHLQRRKKMQDYSAPNAGCAFKNPACTQEGAGFLIEAAGLKGYRIGGAMVSKKHANFIINTGMARSSDVVQLMRFIQKKVWKERGVWLEPEYRFIGSFHEEVLLNGK
ncbi:MAG: UDP-N-acetylmuramate dehydrogenase [Candidatus Omnitrophica bacterium]|nr:UDP-N-acetylmuramate dehydrogenase [Candidatus Omnitrophota bacterium]